MTAVAIGANVIKDFETGGIGVQWSNLTEISESNFNFATVLAMLLFDFVLYGAGFIYLSNVLPSEYGAQRSPLYPCQTCMRCCCHRRSKPASGRWAQQDSLGQTLLQDAAPDSTAIPPKQEQPQSAIVEPVNEVLLRQVEQGRTVSFDGLGRTFETPAGLKHAVVNLNLTLFEGQVSVLLGPNVRGQESSCGMSLQKKKALCCCQ